MKPVIGLLLALLSLAPVCSRADDDAAAFEVTRVGGHATALHVSLEF